ncbi:hypothetical protein MHI43_27205 [Paenibacillus sp. FSL H8-0457]|uniref:hypothetical protein n=1 Tax=Paenibacillus TaxID=44249 RepID=UPI000178823F|nr:MULTISPECIES: hypothetical protein [unclassified Paenibacillus]ACX67594.1 conserved hypothetical protein [Paenibacillus sp. Y412MC10]ETT58701.1 hypothetical protein C172_25985 [Paenibacillus sp. FSL H8-457]
MSKKETAPTFNKHQLVQSNQFSNREKDVLSAILEVGKTYTVQQAKEQLTTFLKKEVI